VNESELRLRLVSVLWERLAELEADAAREAIWQKTNWDLVVGDSCPRCHKPSLRFRDGVCLPCVADFLKKADRLAKLVKSSEKHGLWVFPKKKARLVQ